MEIQLMNTLPRAVTAQFFPDPESYTALRRQWRLLLTADRRHELTAAHHLLYLALLGKDRRRGFTPITNARKLENGAFTGWALFRAFGSIAWVGDEPALLAPFAGTVTPGMLLSLRALLPPASPYACRPEDFAAGFPWDAYTVPEALAAAPQPEDLSRG
jgi:hypothetical protein